MSNYQQQAADYASQQKEWSNQGYGWNGEMPTTPPVPAPTLPGQAPINPLMMGPPPPPPERAAHPPPPEMVAPPSTNDPSQQAWSGYGQWNAYGAWQQPGAWPGQYGYPQPGVSNPWGYYYGAGAPPPPPADDSTAQPAEPENSFDESTDPDLLEFDKQFRTWEEKYDTWKEENKNHPDKESLASYEATWKKWREDLLKKRDDLKKTKIASNTQVTNTPVTAPTEKVPPPNNVSAAYENNSAYLYPPYGSLPPTRFEAPGAARPPIPQQQFNMHHTHLNAPPPHMMRGPRPYMQRGPRPYMQRGPPPIITGHTEIPKHGIEYNNPLKDDHNSQSWPMTEESSPIFSSTGSTAVGIPGLDILQKEEKQSRDINNIVPQKEIKAEVKIEEERVSKLDTFNRNIGPIGLGPHAQVDPNVARGWKPPGEWYEDDDENENGEHRAHSNKRDASEMANMETPPNKLFCNKPYPSDLNSFSQMSDTNRMRPQEMANYREPFSHGGRGGRLPLEEESRLSGSRFDNKYMNLEYNNDRNQMGREPPEDHFGRGRPSERDRFGRGGPGDRFGRGGPLGNDRLVGGPLLDDRFGRGGPEGDRFGRDGPAGDRFGRGGPAGDRFDRAGPEEDRIGRGRPGEDRIGGGGPGDGFGRGGPEGDRIGRGRPGDGFGRGGPEGDRIGRGGPGDGFGRGGPEGDRFGRGRPEGDRFGRGRPEGDRFGRGRPEGDKFDKGGPVGDSFGRGGPVGDSFGRGGPVGDSFGRGGPVGDKFGRGGPAGDRFGRGGPTGDAFGRGGPAGDRFGRGGPTGDRFGRGGPTGDAFGRSEPIEDDRFGRGGPPGDRFSSRGRPSEEERVGRGPTGDRFGRGDPPQGDLFSGGPQGDSFGRRLPDADRQGREQPEGSRYSKGPPEGDRLGRGTPQGDRLGRGTPQGDRLGRGTPPGDRLGRGTPQGDRLGRGPPEGDRFARGPPEGDRFARGPPEGDRFGRGPPEGDRFGRGPPEGDRFARGLQEGDRFGRGPPQGDRFAKGPSEGDRFGRGTSEGDRFGRGPSEGDRFGRGPQGDMSNRGQPGDKPIGGRMPEGDRLGRGATSAEDRLDVIGHLEGDRFGRGGSMLGGRFHRGGVPSGDRFGRGGPPPSTKVGFGREPPSKDGFGRAQSEEKLDREVSPSGDRFSGGHLEGDRFGRRSPDDRQNRGPNNRDRFGKVIQVDSDMLRGTPMDRFGRGCNLNRFGRGGLLDKPSVERPGHSNFGPGLGRGRDEFDSEREKGDNRSLESNRYNNDKDGRPGRFRPEGEKSFEPSGFSRSIPHREKFTKPEGGSTERDRLARIGSNEKSFGSTLYGRTVPHERSRMLGEQNLPESKFLDGPKKTGLLQTPPRDEGYRDSSRSTSSSHLDGFNRADNRQDNVGRRSDFNQFSRINPELSKGANFERGYRDCNQFDSKKLEHKPQELMKLNFEKTDQMSTGEHEIDKGSNHREFPNRTGPRMDERKSWQHDRPERNEQHRSRDNNSEDPNSRSLPRDRFRTVHDKPADNIHNMDNNRSSDKKSKNDSSSVEKLHTPEKTTNENKEVEQPKGEKVSIDDIISVPGRFMRPPKLVIILRGLPGSGKTTMAKMIKNREIENGGSAPRILCLDDYFMVETEKMTKDNETGRTVKTKAMEYEYEPELEDQYRAALIKSFKKQVDEKFFPFIIVDCIHSHSRNYMEICDYAQKNDFESYIAELDVDIQTCVNRNSHGRERIDIQRLSLQWERSPAHITELDLTSYMQDADIQEVEMEDCMIEEDKDIEEVTKEKLSEDDESVETFTIIKQLMKSKWDTVDGQEATLDKLDGVRTAKKKMGESKPQSIEDWLQLSKEFDDRDQLPGKKRVRWADIEERKKQENARERGFVLGQTDWQRMTDPSMGSSALVQVKYI